MDREQEEKLIEITKFIQDARRILVLSGAGISTHCGIPDFRSAGGLYETAMEKFHLPYPEAIFEMDFFIKNPKPFYRFTQEFFSKSYEPSLFHRLISQLEKENKELLVVTQNIDGIHQLTGSQKVLPCHGDYSQAYCIKDRSHKIPMDQFMETAKKGEIPYCPHCKSVVKPAIVFFGESLPSSFLKLYQNPGEWDLFLAVGSSLTVEPAASFAGLMATTAKHSIRLNNRETPYDPYFTMSINEDLEVIAKILEKNLSQEQAQ